MSGFKLQIINFDFYGGDVNAFVLETEHFVFLIDNAVGSAKTTIRKALKGTALDRKKLMVLNTHAHWDHSSLNGYLKEQYGATILGHPKALELCDKEKQYEVVYNRYADFRPSESSVYWEEFAYPAAPDSFLHGGECIEDDGFKLHVIYTPGHSDDALSFYEENSGLLFAGDAVQGNGFDGNSPYYCDAEAYITSLQKLLPLKPKSIFCGHGMVQGEAEADAFLKLSVEKFEAIDNAIREELKKAEPGAQLFPGLATDLAKKFGYPDSMHILTTAKAHVDRLQAVK